MVAYEKDTIPPGPDDEITIEERVKLLQNQVIDLKGAINVAFATLHDRLDKMQDALTANMGLIREQIRHHSTRIHQLELANMNGDKQS